MSSKKKFKRDYIILEAKDINFRNKERVLPKAFAKVEVNNDKSLIALYVENLKYFKDGYDAMAITTKYDVLDLGKIILSEQGRGEFILDLDENEDDIKSIAIVHKDKVPLIGFKGSKLDNYEDILFEVDEEYDDYDEEEYEDTEEDEEYEECSNEDELDSDRDSEYDEDYVDAEDEYNRDEDDEEPENPEEEEFREDFEPDNLEEEEFREDFEADSFEDDVFREDFNESEDYFGDEDFLEDDVFESDSVNSDMSGDFYKNENSSNDEMIELNNFSKIEYRQKYAEGNTDNEEDPLKYVSNRKKVKSKTHKSNQHLEGKKDVVDQDKVAGTLMMPRQIKKGLKHFKEVKPFIHDQIDNTRWWKIDINPTTLCGYSMPNLGYVNALNYTMYSDIVINAYKHRHYLFGVQYDEYNNRENYIYAIPGVKNEKPDNGNTGFFRFQSSDNRSNRSTGYWMCFIDARLRTIQK